MIKEGIIKKADLLNGNRTESSRNKVYMDALDDFKKAVKAFKPKAIIRLSDNTLVFHSNAVIFYTMKEEEYLKLDEEGRI